MKKKKNKIAFCFDLDGTLTYEEILPLLASEINLYEEMKLLTNITMNGLMSFEQSFRLRVKLLSNISLSKANKIIMKIPIQKKVANFIRKNKNNCFIITGNLDVWVDNLINKNFGCKYFSSKALLKDGKIIDVKSVMYKDSIIEEIKNDFDKIVSIGDGMNDAPMFEKSDISIAYGALRELSDSLIKLSNFVTYSEEGLCNILNTL